VEQTRILVISSFVLLREGLRALLDAFPFWHVTCEAPSWEKVRQQTIQMNPDIVVLDVPQVDARFETLIHNLKAAPKAPAIVVLSRQDDEDSLIRILKSGIQGCLCATSDPDELIAAIRAVTTGASFLCPAASRVLLQDYRRQARGIQHDNAA